MKRKRSIIFITPSLTDNMFYFYVLQSLTDKDLYFGYTDNLKRRFKEHHDGRVIATRRRLPMHLAYYEA